MMREGEDYGVIPGTRDKRKTLLKPGAEKLTTFFGLTKRCQIVEKVADWDGSQHGSEPFFYYLYRCHLLRGELLIAEADGSCNSWEKKYRFRNGMRLCPQCGAAAITKSRGGGGWQCFRGKDGCGATWADGDPVIEDRATRQCKTENPADLVNTIQKMAQKRALIAATLLAVNASEFFTQDLEDMDEAVANRSTVLVRATVLPAPVASVPTKPSVSSNRDATVDMNYRKFSAMFRAARTTDKLQEFWNKLEQQNPSPAVLQRLTVERGQAEKRIAALANTPS
jgi:hypothetical protein